MAGHLGWTRYLVVCGVLSALPAAAQDGALVAPDVPAAAMPGVAALPDEPAPQDVAEYVRQIAEVTAALPNDPRRDDPQAALLEALADDHLDELFQAHEAYPQLRYYLDPIIHREIARRGGPDAERLEMLTLHADADDDAAWSHVLDIARVSAGQRRVSASDPQVAMLRALAPDNMPALIDAVEIEALRFYALLAIRGGVTAEHKATIVASLLDQPRLIGVIRQEGWEEDAREQLILGLELGVEVMPRTWVQAVVDLQDEATYDALLTQLLRSRCSQTYYRMMQDLPGIDLTSAVHAAWEHVVLSPTDRRELRALAEVAASHGHTDALGYLIDALPAEATTDPVRDEELRQVVLRRIPFEGTNAQIKAWYDANGSRLHFDRENACFYVSGLLQ